MADRSLWCESHLLNDRAGRQARAACERLGPEVHEQILAAGDRLASASPAVAQQFYLQAAGVWQRLGTAGFERWLALGAALAADSGHRDAALTYFGIRAGVVERAGLDAVATWCDLGRALSAASRKLAALFFQHTAPLLGRVDLHKIQAFCAQAIRLHNTAGWRGEFLAQAYLATAPAVLRSLSAPELPQWVSLGVALQSSLREAEFFGPLPPGLGALHADERAPLFAALIRMAETTPQAAVAVYRALPAALRRFHPQRRASLLDVVAAAGPIVPTQLADIAPVVGALIRDIAARHRQAALHLAVRVAREFPRGGVCVLRSLPIAYEQTDPPAVEQWVTRGLSIAADNAAAGEAYFALESRTSQHVLRASSTAADIGQVQGMLRKYIHMLSGRPAALRGADGFLLRPPIEEFPEEDAVTVPLVVNAFDTHEDNCRAYQLIAAHLAARREFGTYAGAGWPESTDLYHHLRAPEHPVLFEDLFLLVEGVRVAAAIARAYPGLGVEQHELARQFVRRQPLSPAPAQRIVLDTLLAALLAQMDGGELPEWLQSLAAVVGAAIPPLRAPHATVADALAIAESLARVLSPPPADRGETSLGDIFLNKVSGDALIDPYLDEDLPGSDVAPFVQTAGESPNGEAPEEVQLELDPASDEPVGTSVPLSAEDLRRLLESGANLRIQQGYGDDTEGLGLYISDLIGKLPADQLDAMRRLLEPPEHRERAAPKRWLERQGEGIAFHYDEWDYHIADYRQRWCCLREFALDGDAGEFFNRTLLDYAQLLPEVRRQFQRIRPEMYRIVRGLEDGEDFDLNAVVNARVDRRAHRSPSPKLYVARAREERDVATLFLIDMSASTDEPVQKLPPLALGDEDEPPFVPRRGRAPKPRRIIDITKEALVVMAAALDEIGDAYAIYGFSGHGRNNVEFYLVKSFNEPLSASVKGRIGGIEPKRSTRMGTALRHATEKMAGITSRSRHIILLSDGFPQDFDYGQDRRSNVYGLRDTSVALREAEASGITPFCITVDKAGHDYLREMCDSSRYMIIEDIAALPRELPKIYQRVVTL